ncbi:2OG-Fe(II) oxygenase [Xenorhabdus sp. SGI246]|uniref:2OG-Fe(II) oxygenase n=1 Tax=Xenorhabdus sp. SGI246 TaxID=3158263 RepID=UPI00349F4F6D
MKGIVMVDRLNYSVISELLHGEAKIVSISSSYDHEISSKISKQILNRMNIGYYENAPKIGRIGMAFFESIDSMEKRDFYYKNANKWNFELRDACFPYLSPISYLLSELDTSWVKGAKLATFKGNKMFSGLARIFKDGSSAEPHQDIFLRDAPELNKHFPIKEQLAFNIYLDVPEKGGEIELWNWKATDQEFHNFQNKNPDLAYGMDREKIRKPDIVYKPKKGEILLFNPRNVHAVAPSNGTPRLTISTFIGYSSDNEELVLWS